MLSVVAVLPVKPDEASCKKFEKEFAKGAARVQSSEAGCLLYQVSAVSHQSMIYDVCARSLLRTQRKLAFILSSNYTKMQKPSKCTVRV